MRSLTRREEVNGLSEWVEPTEMTLVSEDWEERERKWEGLRGLARGLALTVRNQERGEPAKVAKVTTEVSQFIEFKTKTKPNEI